MFREVYRIQNSTRRNFDRSNNSLLYSTVLIERSSSFYVDYAMSSMLQSSVEHNSMHNAIF